MKKTITSALFIFFLLTGQAQTGVDTLWTRTFGGSGQENTAEVTSFARTKIAIDSEENIFIATGTTSRDYDVRKNSGLVDCWVIKLNSKGDTLWSKVIGGSANDICGGIVADQKGGCILVGTTGSDDGSFTSTGHYGNLGEQDGFVAIFDSNGDIKKIKQYGSKKFLANFSDGTTDSIGGNDELYNIIATSDGNYMCVGNTDSYDNDLAPMDETQSWGGWFLKIDSNGKKISSKKISHDFTLGDSYLHFIYEIVETKEGDFICLGELYSITTGSTFWVFRSDGIDNINKKWSQNYTSYSFSSIASITKKDDDTYVVCGGIGDVAGDVLGHVKGGGDTWVFEVSASSGQINNQNVFGGSMPDEPKDILTLKNGNLLVSGYSKSNDYDSPGGYGLKDFWMIELNNDLDTILTYKIGGSNNDIILDVAQSLDGSALYVVGSTQSSDYYVNKNRGSTDIWLGKLIENQTIDVNIFSENKQISCSPNPSKGIFNIENCKNKTLIIKDVLGKSVYSEQIKTEQKTINLENLTKGVYFMTFDDDVNNTLKIVIN